ncbi:hypothetical protein HanHA89_Chr03g0121461 [Helianthus annuus]|nr:hypothetical protein HanHA89_Chr03g0121461 [Helianthus annuus]
MSDRVGLRGWVASLMFHRRKKEVVAQLRPWGMGRGLGRGLAENAQTTTPGAWVGAWVWGVAPMAWV